MKRGDSDEKEEGEKTEREEEEEGQEIMLGALQATMLSGTGAEVDTQDEEAEMQGVEEMQEVCVDEMEEETEEEEEEEEAVIRNSAGTVCHSALLSRS